MWTITLLISLFACFLFYILATSKVISGRVQTYDSVHSWQLYSAASLGHQAASTMTCYPTVTSWHWANKFLLYPNNAECQARKRRVSILKFCFDPTRFKTHRIWIRTRDFQIPDLPEWEAGAPLIRPPRLVKSLNTLTEEISYTVTHTPDRQTHTLNLPQTALSH